VFEALFIFLGVDLFSVDVHQVHHKMYKKLATRGTLPIVFSKGKQYSPLMVKSLDVVYCSYTEDSDVNILQLSC
jgi:hypothetical protein